VGIGTAGCWVSTRPSGYVTAFGEVGVPPLGLVGGLGCNLRVTFDGQVRNLGPRFLKFDFPLPEDHRAHILWRATTANSAEAASISGTSVYRGSKRGRRVVRRPRLSKSDCPATGDIIITGEQPSLSSVLSDAPWLNRRRPGSLYSIVEYE
jgi:hypothetical protein